MLEEKQRTFIINLNFRTLWIDIDTCSNIFTDWRSDGSIRSSFLDFD